MEQQIATGDVAPGTRIVLGAYTAEMDGRATGLGSYRWNHADADAVDLVAHAGVALTSPTWVEADAAGRHVYAVTESNEPRLVALALDEAGALTRLNDVAVDGAGACHLALTEDGRHIVVANYGDGTIGSFAINADGTVSEQVDRYAFNWTGPDLERQDRSHAHQVVMDGDGFWVANLGGDTVHRLRLDHEGRFVSEVPPVELPAGTGPRHLVLVEDLMVVACELSAQLWVGRRDPEQPGAGRHAYRQVALVDSTTRERDLDDNRVYPSGIAVHRSPDGIEVLVANRVCDTVAVFGLDTGTGEPTLLDEFATGGWPRDLKVSGDRAWVASQTEDRVVSHVRVGPGQWVDDFEFPAPTPACVLLVAPTPR